MMIGFVLYGERKEKGGWRWMDSWRDGGMEEWREGWRKEGEVERGRKVGKKERWWVYNIERERKIK